MPAFASLVSAAAAGGLASLDLCADEYLLMFAARDQIASLSFLAADPADSALADRARGIPTNRGSLESLLDSGAKTVLTTRPLGRFDMDLAKRLGLQVVQLEVGEPDAVARSVETVSRLAGRPGVGRSWRLKLRELRARAPATLQHALWIGPGGVGMSPDSPTARWLAYAGIDPVPAASGLSRVEQVVTSDAPLILRSRYREGHYARSAAYLEHPLVRRSERRQIDVDGRRFLCSGPLMLDEIIRLKRELGN